MRILTSTRAAAVAAAACMALAPAAPAFATGSSSPELRQPLPLTAVEFEKGECPESIPADKDGWHFVLPGNKAEFVELTVTFEPGGTQTITEFDVFGKPFGKHAYVASEPGAKLVDIEAEIKGSVKGDKFNLSHTCPATDTTGGSTGETTEGATGETTEGTTGGGEETTGGSTEGTSEGTTGETTEGTTGETTEGTTGGGEETTGGTEGSTGEGSTGETTEGTTGDEATEGVAGGEEPGETTGEGGNLAETGSEAPVAALAAAAAALLGAGSYLVMRRRKATQG
ncbi:LPXTG cell wall anchor domain-containing protein [Streptomyces sp. S1A]|uniref:LPXTG cell wall anchor domain-containing protein n=1 Tax=Streptomyces sp. ICN903 TaxID=2964654 RepID=UPI001EDC4502|nr:LPXTG cell wall anchor domain-containing protein [Streptomyces sp. ICN903]MCG3042367.1 LPXTG cell wall anchor domain-containing protein [Streptomyces sp. ICN903]